MELTLLCLVSLFLLHPFPCSSVTEADVLLEFKNNLNDTRDSLRNWNPDNKPNLCNWTGISCDSSTKTHVVSIQLTALLLEGSITPSIGLLPHLISLNLSRNYYLGGAIPFELTNCSILEVLDLSYNLFDGPVPDFLGRLSRLKYLALRWNYYEGAIPSSLANCSQLEVLDLSRNQLSGRIPESLSRLAKLQNFSIADNLYVQGTIPRSLSNCSSLVGLRLRNNMLNGEVPVELLKMPSLLTLGISQNKFTSLEPGGYAASRVVELNLTDNLFNSSMDELLRGIQQMPRLQILALGEFQQQLRGEVPAGLLSLRSLVSLDLAKNSFDSFPLDWSSTNLRYLDLRFNQFKGLPSHSFPLLSSIKTLLFANNQLTSIPPELFTQKNCSLEALDFCNNNISGTVPGTLSSCPSLQGMDFSKNKLQGELPVSIEQLPNLTYFIAFRNKLTGMVPSRIGLLEKLNYLDLSWNNFSGSLWRNYGPGLQQIDVSQNNLTGQLPQEIGNATRLVRLDLSNNLLSGPIPWQLGQCSSLQQLDVSDNNLSGTLPASLQNLTKLATLNVGKNELTGSIPIDFGAIKNLLLLQLGQNSFTGEIPASLSNISLQRHQVQVSSQTRNHDFFLRSLCSGMEAVDLSGNQFSGKIPLFFCKWTCLMVLSLARNLLDGSIPECITGLTNLQVIDLSSNKLTGVLPEQLDRMEGFRQTNVSVDALGMILKTPEWYSFGGGLFDFGIMLRGAYITSSSLIDSFTFLDLSDNRLEGSIPPKLVRLVSLMHLNLSSNSLSGTIPAGLSKLAILETLDLSRNRFQGQLPEDIAWIPRMSSFSLADNNLSGRIPSANNLNTRFPADAFEGNSGLCDFPLAPCGSSGILGNATQQVPEPETDDRLLLWGFVSAAVPTFVVTVFCSVSLANCQKIKAVAMRVYKKQRVQVMNSSMDTMSNANPQHWSSGTPLSSSAMNL